MILRVTRFRETRQKLEPALLDAVGFLYEFKQIVQPAQLSSVAGLGEFASKVVVGL